MGNACSSDKSTETKDGSNPPEAATAEDNQNGEQRSENGDGDQGNDSRPEGEEAD